MSREMTDVILRMMVVAVLVGVALMVIGCGGSNTTAPIIYDVNESAELPSIANSDSTVITADGNVEYIVLGDDATYIGCQNAGSCSVEISQADTSEDSNETEEQEWRSSWTPIVENGSTSGAR